MANVFKIDDHEKRQLEQFVRSNFYLLFGAILKRREKYINGVLRCAQSETLIQAQGRAMELDDLMSLLKIKADEGE
jgi:hypothetical protein